MRVPGKQTNNNAEIFAIIKAIERVKTAGNLFVHHIFKKIKNNLKQNTIYKQVLLE